MKRWVLTVMFLSLSTGCTSENAQGEIAKIPEASGICFSHKSKTLFVANDEGKVYEINKDGKILREKRLGEYDLEGVACDDGRGELLFAQEGADNILVVSQKSLKVKKTIDIKRKHRGKLILKKDKNDGLEAITIIDGAIFLSNQSHKFLPKKDPSVVIKVDKKQKAKVTIKELFEHGHQDIAGLTYHDKYLFMVSDSEDLLIKYDIQKKRVIATAPLPPFAQEGVAFDDEGYIYIANDEGSVFKYPRKQFGL